jgi:hypothetical protein
MYMYFDWWNTWQNFISQNTWQNFIISV